MLHVGQHRRSLWHRHVAAATVLVLMLAGLLPALHTHQDESATQAHCDHSAPVVPAHLVSLELEHHDACGLCAKSVSSARLQRPLTALDYERVAEHIADRPQALPTGLPGRHGASRAPPAA